jgi:hypothetical protein
MESPSLVFFSYFGWSVHFGSVWFILFMNLTQVFFKKESRTPIRSFAQPSLSGKAAKRWRNKKIVPIQDDFFIPE